MPCAALPTAPVPTSLLPCWVRIVRLRLKIHTAPVFSLTASWSPSGRRFPPSGPRPARLFEELAVPAGYRPRGGAAADRRAPDIRQTGPVSANTVSGFLVPSHRVKYKVSSPAFGSCSSIGELSFRVRRIITRSIFRTGQATAGAQAFFDALLCCKDLFRFTSAEGLVWC
jgi:hypothetical protein